MPAKTISQLTQATTIASGDEFAVEQSGVTKRIAASVVRGDIANANISASAAIAYSKLASLTGGQIIVGNASNVPTAVAVSGDLTLSDTGAATLAASAVNGKTALTDPLAATDEFLVWDASASALRKVTWNSLQPAGSVLNTVQSVVSTTETITGNIPSDNTIPQQTEGTEIMTATITPKSASNKILVRAVVYISSNAGSWNTAAVFAGSGNDAIAAWLGLYGGYDNQVVIEYLHSPATSSAITYKLRVGSDSGTSYINAYAGGSARYGGVARTTLTLQEIKG